MGTVKILDFGLAKALAPSDSSIGLSVNSPTITTPAMTLPEAEHRHLRSIRLDYGRVQASHQTHAPPFHRRLRVAGRLVARHTAAARGGDADDRRLP